MKRLTAAFLSFGLCWTGFALAETSTATRSWRIVDEFTAEEKDLFDPREETPRDPERPYMPAERYPFQSPFTAEEMGYRAHEFSHSPRWSCTFVDVSGALTAHGYLITEKMHSPIFYVPNAEGHDGLEAELYGTVPGEPTRKLTAHIYFPPENSGNQMNMTMYRAGEDRGTRWDMFIYSPALRRVRRQPQPRRGDRLAEGAESFDDIFGRDPWEFSWKVIGTDTLHETVRFPSTRPTITLGKSDGTLHEVATGQIKMMGDTYPFYTDESAVDCWVVVATVKEEWLPGYYAPKIIYWLDKHHFYPLRIEQYDEDGKLFFIETRVATHLVPRMKDKGYGQMFSHYWDLTLDYMRYSVHDTHTIKEWSAKDQTVFFSPSMLPRAWSFAPRKSQAEVLTPEQYFLRPRLERGKFPKHRTIKLSSSIEEKFRSQEEAGHLVFLEDSDR